MISYENLVFYLSSGRLKRYEDKFFVDKSSKAIELYLLNKKLSESFLGGISLFEVVFRNFMLLNIKNNYKNYGFYNHAFLKSLNIKNKKRFLITVKEKIPNNSKDIDKKIYDLSYNASFREKFSEDLVTSRLSLGFWIALFAKPYWEMFLYRSFNGAIDNHIKNLRLIEKIRNRVCHHEFISEKSELEETYKVMKRYFLIFGNCDLFRFFCQNTCDIPIYINELSLI